MATIVRLGFLGLLVLALLTSHTVSANNARPPRNSDVSKMADALKYLQDLDEHYGDLARVRFGKRTPLMQSLRQHSPDGPEPAPNFEYPIAAEQIF